MKLLLAPLLLAPLALAALQESAEPALEWRTFDVGGVTLRYAVRLPDAFDAGVTHPCLLAFPPGDQSEGLAIWAADSFAEAAGPDWVVIVPCAVDGKTWNTGLEEHALALGEHLLEEFAVEYGRFHVAGISNGGRSALRIVGRHPELAHSLTALPGRTSSDADWARLQNLAHLPIGLYVGGEDTDWVEAARRTESRLGELGAPDVRLTIVEGAGHVLGPEVVRSVFDDLERARARTEAEESARHEVDVVLDRLHAAAASADEATYFASFTPAATFLGTDAKERWSLAEFREYAAPYFERESAWTYTPVERHVEFSPNLRTAWFDERLENAKYGETRGSGVLLETGGRWRVAHYVLSFPIPNEVAEDVVRLVRERK